MHFNIKDNIFSFLYGLFMGDILRMLRFVAVGGCATVVHIFVAWMLLKNCIYLSVFYINLISFLIAFCFSYFGHSLFTFRKKGQILKFAVVSINGFMINNIILVCGKTIGLGDFFSLVIATVMVPVITYILSLLWAFK